MLKNFEDIQVNAFLHISKEELFIKRDSPVKQAFVIINQIAAYIKDAHTYVYNYSPIFKDYEKTLLFPVKVKVDLNCNVMVNRNFAANCNITNEDTLITINRHSVKQLFQKSIDLQGEILSEEDLTLKYAVG